MRDEDVDRIAVDPETEVTSISIDNELHLRLDPGWLVRLASPFRLSSAGVQVDVRPEETETIPPVLALLHKTVSAIEVQMTSGALAIEFADGTSIFAPGDPDYEAWELNNKDGRKYVSVPSNGVAYWGSKQ